MPVINEVTTESSQSIWKSPDGQREIFDVVLNYRGEEFKAKTFSERIAAVGWSGDVVTEDRPGKNGLQTFVKQAPKENGWSPPSTSGGAPSTSSKSGGYQPKDEKAIQAMWAIGQAINAHTNISDDGIADLESVEEYAKELNAMVERVKSGDSKPEPSQPVAVTEEEMDNPIDLSAIDNVFGTSVAKEKPWQTAQ